jgi:hypothetical protein
VKKRQRRLPGVDEMVLSLSAKGLTHGEVSAHLSGVRRRGLPADRVLFTTEPLPVTGSGTAQWRTTASYAAYVRAEVRHEAAVGPLPGVMAAFTNPVFLGV